jgi:hypothetical protein
VISDCRVSRGRGENTTQTANREGGKKRSMTTSVKNGNNSA